MIEIVPKTNDSAQHTDISVNEILIPAKTDPTGIINYKSDVTGINPENTVISLGEAVCFQYMNSSDRLPYAGEQNETSEEQDNTVLKNIAHIYLAMKHQYRVNIPVWNMVILRVRKID